MTRLRVGLKGLASDDTKGDRFAANVVIVHTDLGTRVQTMTAFMTIKELVPRLFLASRDPMIVRSFGRRLKAAGIETVTGDPDWASIETDPPRSKDMIVLGPGDMRRLNAGLGLSAANKAILVGVPAANVAGVLGVLARFGRPRAGDGIFILENKDAPLEAIVALAANGYLAIPADVVAGIVERAALHRLATTLGTDDRRLLSLLVQGLPNPQIADALGWEQSQVKSRLRVLMRRLNQKNRTAAAVAALRLGFGTDTA